MNNKKLNPVRKPEAAGAEADEAVGRISDAGGRTGTGTEGFTVKYRRRI